jgi:hypothetical protein
MTSRYKQCTVLVTHYLICRFVSSFLLVDCAFEAL